MTYNLLWEWRCLRTVLPAAKIGSSGVAPKAEHFSSPLHRQTASWMYGISVRCISLPTFLSSPTYQPRFKATSTASLFSYNHSLIVGSTLKAFSRPVSDPLLATSSNPVWPSLHLAVPSSYFVLWYERCLLVSSDMNPCTVFCPGCLANIVFTTMVKSQE